MHREPDFILLPILVLFFVLVLVLILILILILIIVIGLIFPPPSTSTPSLLTLRHTQHPRRPSQPLCSPTSSF